MAESTLNGHWQTTVPAEVRRALGLEAGTRLVWELCSDGALIVRPSAGLSSGLQGGADGHASEVPVPPDGLPKDPVEDGNATLRGDISTSCGAWGVDFLFTPSVQRMLAAALMHPGREYTLEEMLSIAATGRGNTQRQLERLLDSGVMSEGQRQGRQRRIAVNRHHFLHPELESIACKSFGLIFTLENILQPYSGCIDLALVLRNAPAGIGGGQGVDLVLVGRICEASLLTELGRLGQRIGRSIHLHMYSRMEWQDLLSRDPAVAGAARNAEMVSTGRKSSSSVPDDCSDGGISVGLQPSGFIQTRLGSRGR